MKTRNGNGNDPGEDQRHLAVLIDADNAQASVIGGLLAEVAKYGVANVKRIYGDFTSQRLASWKAVLLDHSIQPMQQFAYTSGKNATDSSLIIDAMDLMYTGRFQGMCLVTSDSDFTRLAQRLREEGLVVYGFGERKTPDAFVQACDKFIYVELLPRSTKSVATPTNAPPVPPARVAAAKQAAKVAAKQSAAAKPTPPPSPTKKGAQIANESLKAGAVGEVASTPSTKSGGKGVAAGGGKAGATGGGKPASAPAPKATSLTEVTLVDAALPEPPPREPLPRNLLAQAIETASDEQGWAHLGAVGSYLNKVRPDFDPRLHGHRKLSDLVRAHPHLFEVQERGEGTAKAVFVRAKE